jgi:acyl-coenzyme A thioesterase PaaI-like protein
MFDFQRDLDPDDARFRLAAATRRVIAELASSTASDDAFSEACQLVEEAATVLGDRPHGRGYVGAEASLAEHQDSHFLDFSPLVGPLNPLAPPIATQIVDGIVIGQVVYGDAYEGPPGCVHGGFIAAGFDEMLGFAQSLSGEPGMTGRLQVSYRSPTPLHRPVRYEGRVDRIEGRKIFTVGTLHHDDTLCAEAEGLFISMKPEVFQRLMRDRPLG